MNWDDLNILLAISRAGNLVGAAKRLGINHSTVFRRINNIEKSLGVRLFNRLSSGYIPTEAGSAALISAERIDEEVSALSLQLAGKDERLQGQIKITAPEGIAFSVLPELLSEFSKRHPLIEIDLLITSNALLLSKREADIALRVTNSPPDTNIGKCISSFAFAVYATPEFLENCNHDEKNYSWILSDNANEWFPHSFWKEMKTKTARSVFTSNSIQAVFDACKQGIGIAALPCFMGDAEENLVRVIHPDIATVKELWILMHPDLRNTTRVRKMMLFLHENLSKLSDLFSGNTYLNSVTV